MSRMNIRTLADLRREDEAAAAGETTPFVRSGSEGGGDGYASEGRRSLPIRFLELLFPNVTWKSSLIVISVAQWALYITTIAVGSELPLVPDSKVLIDFGANVPALVQKGEVHRLVLPIFLHANFIHIFFNVFFQLRMGFTLERRYGLVRFLLVFFATGIFGNIFSGVTLFCDPFRVGASTSGFGMIGLEMAELALRWHRIRHRDRALVDIVVFLLMMTLFIFTANGRSIDQMGHLGGFLCGVALAFVLNYDLEDKPQWYGTAFWVAAVSNPLLWGICTPVLFAVRRDCGTPAL